VTRKASLAYYWVVDKRQAMTGFSGVSGKPAARRHTLETVVAGIEIEMRQARLWASTPPAASRIASDLPFCCDTLSFHQWLQWLFMPRMHEILEHGDPLPSASAILPYAEETLAHAADRAPGELAGLMFLLGEFDDLINRKTRRPPDLKFH
jgi:uncharacterized protein YqcC (DUF446 family)